MRVPWGENASRMSARFVTEAGAMALSSTPMQTVPFMARCPNCGYDWLQDGYTRQTLIALLRAQPSIKAYCICCAVLWPISAEELRAISEALAE